MCWVTHVVLKNNLGVSRPPWMKTGRCHRRRRDGTEEHSVQCQRVQVTCSFIRRLSFLESCCIPGQLSNQVPVSNVNIVKIKKHRCFSASVRRKSQTWQTVLSDELFDHSFSNRVTAMLRLITVNLTSARCRKEPLHSFKSTKAKLWFIHRLNSFNDLYLSRTADGLSARSPAMFDLKLEGQLSVTFKVGVEVWLCSPFAPLRATTTLCNLSHTGQNPVFHSMTCLLTERTNSQFWHK